MTAILNEQQNNRNKFIICRICGVESENGQKLFNSNNSVEKLAVQICSFISIKLEKIQIYPNWICPDCQLQFETTNKFFDLIRYGQNELAKEFKNPKKAVRRSKRNRVHPLTVDDNQLDGLPPDNVKSPRKRKAPKKFVDSMQGNELEDLYQAIGITKRKRKQYETQAIAQIEDEDGATLGQMHSVSRCQKKSTRFECDFCNEKFVKELAFFNHLSYHKNILYECTECEETFQAKAMFDKHVNETKHSGLGIIETPSLEIAPQNQEETNTTKSQGPPAIPPARKFACMKCQMPFTTHYAMIRHQITHSNHQPFKCDVCSATFKRKAYLANHKVTHSQERKFECHKCTKKFLHKQSLSIHLRIHDGLRPYVCSICKKSFVQQSHLKEHKRIHSGERPFVCLICGTAFKTASQCRLHQKTHATREHLTVNEVKQNILCKVCERPFTNPNNMRKHLRLHTGELPYACHLCPKRFSDPSNFKKHKLKHSKGEKPKKEQKPKRKSLLKKNFKEPNPPDSDSFGFMGSNLISILENISPPNKSCTVDENNDENAKQWNSDLAVTNIPNDDSAIIQQQQLEQKLMNQLVCISYQDPMNPVGSKTTFMSLIKEVCFNKESIL